MIYAVVCVYTLIAIPISLFPLEQLQINSDKSTLAVIIYCAVLSIEQRKSQHQQGRPLHMLFQPFHFLY